MNRPSSSQSDIIRKAMFFFVLTISTAAFVWLVHGFLMPVFWAVVLAVVFSPLERRWRSLVGQRTVATILTLVTVFLFVFIPLWFVGGLVVDESVSTYASLSNSTTRSAGLDLIEAGVGQLSNMGFVDAHRELIISKTQELAQTASRWFALQAIGLGQATFGFVAKFFLMTYVLFFLLRDRASVRAAAIRVLPLGDEREQRVFRDFIAIVRSIFKGTLLIALVQGVIGGVLFYIAGIDGALLWAVVMTLLSVIPAIGPGLVWLPAGVILLATGALWQGAVVLAGGMFIISLIDNVLRPFLLRKDVGMPDAVILLSVLGGLSLFGITGFIIGPVIAGLCFSMWRIFGDDYPEA